MFDLDDENKPISKKFATEKRSKKEEFDEVDPWAFFVSAFDERGHSSSVRVRIPQWWSGAIGYLVDNIHDYRTISDFIRDSMLHRAIFLMRNLENVNECILAPLELAAESERVRYEQTSMKTINSDIKKAAQGFKKLRDPEGLSAYLERQRETAVKLREPYRARVLATIRQIEDGCLT